VYDGRNEKDKFKCWLNIDLDTDEKANCTGLLIERWESMTFAYYVALNLGTAETTASRSNTEQGDKL